MEILAFAASSSTKSINKKLAIYSVGLLNNAQAEILDLNDYELPLFSEDKELELGQPQLAHDFLSKIGNSDAVVISLAEHNGSYSAAYKNLFDWCSRINPKVFQSKPMILLSTSPGKGGGASVLATAITSAKFFDGNVKGSLSVPNFYEVFDMENNIIKSDDVNSQLHAVMQNLLIS
ncbi:MAG: chromate reductase [Candidatus Deianiraeaceae bacterium]|jgi:chromate reductase